LIIVPVQKRKHVVSLAHLVLLFGLLLFSNVSLLTTTNNVDECAVDGMITLINNAISVFMFVVISQVIIIPTERTDDTGQSGEAIPSLLT
jgi:hypothetical protein